MQLDWLADAHRDAGLTVVEHTGWKTRSMRDFDEFTPVGLINHHTAGSSVLTNYPAPPFWNPARLETKCNLTLRPDGVVVVVNAGYAFDSGFGAPEVLAAVRDDQPLPDLDGLTSDVLGNRWFIDNEVQHRGDGGVIAPVQLEALIVSNMVICTVLGWAPETRLIGHREWAPDRKIDPRWNGFANPMPDIRAATRLLMEADMPSPKDWDAADWQAVRSNVWTTPGQLRNGDYTRSPQQALSRTEMNVRLLRGEIVDDADLAAAVQQLKDEVPDRVLAALVAELTD